MATRGRKPAPERCKILKGSRADRLNPDAPSGVLGVPDCPPHVVSDEKARAEWDRMAGLLERMGVIAQSDGAALAIYCLAFSRWHAAREQVEKLGLVISTSLGGVKPNPAVTIAAAAEAQMTKLLAEFGCTPSSRGRLRVGGEKPKSKLAAFLGGAKRKA